MNGRKLGILVVLLGFVFFVMSIFSFIIIYYLSLRYNKPIENEENELYQYSFFNPSENGTKIGFSRINQKLSDDEYILFFNRELGITSLISHFYDSEYECTGSCYCSEDDNKRRNSATLINRGLFIILSAVSSTMAYSIAKETFRNDCEHKLFAKCSINNIQTEVENCESKESDDLSSENEENDEESEILEDGEEGESEKVHKEYLCHGHCIPFSKHLLGTSFGDNMIGDALRQTRESFGDCRKLETSGVVAVEVSFARRKSTITNPKARKIFRAKYLKNFCKNSSLVEAEVDGMVIKINACEAAIHGKNFIKNIRCKLIQ